MKGPAWTVGTTKHHPVPPEREPAHSLLPSVRPSYTTCAFSLGPSGFENSEHRPRRATGRTEIAPRQYEMAWQELKHLALAGSTLSAFLLPPEKPGS